jgi:hypothetical protein
MPLTTRFPKPTLGDVFVRRNLNGNDEEAMILAIQSKTGTSLWQAVMTTKNGVEFVTGDADYRNIHDWRPQGWLFDSENGNWVSPAAHAKLETERAAKAAEVVAEPETKDEFLVADAAEIPNAITRKRSAVPLPKVPAPPQV